MFLYARKTFFKKVVYCVLTGFVASFFVGLDVAKANMVALDNEANHVVISEVQIYGESGFDDFVELYNPTDQDVDVSDWSIQKTNDEGGALYRKSLSGTILAHGYYLIVRNQAETVQSLKDMADVLASGTSFALSNNYVVYLVNNDEDITDAQDANIVDMMGMGSALIYEGVATAPNPGQGESIERKSGVIHNEANGNGYDTDNNANDFVLRAVSQAQNSGSGAEPVDGQDEDGGDEGEEGDQEEDAGDEEGAADHVVISEIQMFGVSAYDDFVELYNPTDQDVDVSDWSIQKTNQEGEALYRRRLSGVIPVGGYYLIVRNHEETSSQLKDLADTLGSASGLNLFDDNIIYLVNNDEDIVGAQDENIVDLVGMGDAVFHEGVASALNPEDGMSVARKSGAVHEEDAGNGYDTDENSQDFLMLAAPDPYNSQGQTLDDIDDQEEDVEDEEDENEDAQDEQEEDDQSEDADQVDEEDDQQDQIWQAWKWKDFSAIKASRQKDHKFSF